MYLGFLLGMRLNRAFKRGRDILRRAPAFASIAGTWKSLLVDMDPFEGSLL